jgi:hypothetical protein
VLTIPSVSLLHAGTYEAVVTDEVGFTTSKAARLTLALPIGQLTDNLIDPTRLPVTALDGMVLANNRGATREPSEPLHGTKTSRHSLWMTWVAPAVPGIARFDTRGSGLTHCWRSTRSQPERCSQWRG